MTGPNIISINGIPLPAPMTYSVDYQDLDSSDTGRSEDGTLHRKRVRGGVVKIKATWELLDTTQAEMILAAVSPESFTVTYFFGTQRTATMYAGDRSCQLLRVNNNQAKWNIGFDLIQF